MVPDFELYDKVLESFSSPDRILLESELSEIAMETGSNSFDSSSFVHATMELVQNSAMHNYGMGAGRIFVHARFTPEYNLSSVVSGGRNASFENVNAAFQNSISFYKTLEMVKAEKLPKTELFRLLAGSRGKGIKDTIGRIDYFGFTLDAGTHYQMIVSLKGIKEPPKEFLN